MNLSALSGGSRLCEGIKKAKSAQQPTQSSPVLPVVQLFVCSRISFVNLGALSG